MKKLETMLVACLCAFVLAIWAPTADSETLMNSKVLLHGVKKDTTNHWGTAGWFVLPNPGSKVVVAVAGPRYDQPNWWLECNLGVFGKESKAEALLDIRASYDVNATWNLWSNIEYYGTSKNWYAYLDVTCKIGDLGRIGLETENMLLGDGVTDDYSYGPRIVMPFNSQLALIGAYQFHAGPDKLWARAVINF